MADPKKIRDVYIRVCRDAGFKMDAVRVAHFVGSMFKVSALEVAAAFPYIHVMVEVANGSHAALKEAS